MSDLRISAQVGYTLWALVPNTSSSEPGEWIEVEFYGALGAGRSNGEHGWELIPWHRIAQLDSRLVEPAP